MNPSKGLIPLRVLRGLREAAGRRPFCLLWSFAVSLSRSPFAGYRQAVGQAQGMDGLTLLDSVRLLGLCGVGIACLTVVLDRRSAPQLISQSPAAIAVIGASRPPL